MNETLENKERLHIAIAGGSGMLGQAARKVFERLGHNVTIFTRRKDPGQGFVTWDPAVPRVETTLPFDVIINLAGAGIMDRPWSESYKIEILESRTRAVRALDHFICEQNNSPVFINASAVGYYGHDNTYCFTENDEPRQSDFLSDVCVQWENAVVEMKAPVAAKYILRIGVVMSRRGGAWPQMNPFGQMGLTPRLGKGDQFVSWIHIDDLMGILSFLLKKRPASGIYNAVAPHPETYGDMARASAESGRIKLSPGIPEFLLKLILGERSLMVLNSTRVSSEKVRDAGYNFKYSDWSKVVKHLINRK